MQWYSGNVMLHCTGCENM